MGDREERKQDKEKKKKEQKHVHRSGQIGTVAPLHLGGENQHKTSVVGSRKSWKSPDPNLDCFYKTSALQSHDSSVQSHFHKLHEWINSDLL